MKRFFVLMFALTLTATVFSQAIEKVTGPVVAWEKSTHDFGDMAQGDKVEHAFKFTNTGNEPLVITNVEVTCGCTLPKSWPRDPIMPGNNGEIVVAFNSAGKIGKQNKVVTVVSNASNPDGKQIIFSANVLEKKLPNK
ncbi:MAG: DUF1573 domain-containing protein [Bacteroidota bacterium]